MEPIRLQPEDQPNVFRFKGHWLAVGGLLLLTAILMLPRLLSAQFGLFDDPTAIMVSEKLQAGSFHWGEDPTYGRYRPLYWLYYAGLHGLFGRQPIWFFAGNAVILALVVVGVYLLVRRAGGSSLHAALAGAILLLSGPVIENFYTLSKPEMLQSVCLVLFWLSGSQDLSHANKLRQGVFFLLSSLLALMSCMTKETGVILPAIAFAWTIVATILERFKAPVKFKVRQRFSLTLAAFLGVAVFLILRSQSYDFSLIAEGYGSHFTFSMDYILSKIGLWKTWLLRDYLFLITLFPALVVSLFWKKEPEYLHASLDALVWIGAWFVIYLPWMFTVEYYLLPFAIGAAILSANLVVNCWTAFRSPRWLARLVGVVILAISLFFFILTIPNNYSNAGLQLMTDASNAEMLRYVAEHVPPKSVVLLNIQEPNEYIEQARIQLNYVENRPDLQVDYVHDQSLVEENGQSVYIAQAVIENQFFPTVRTGISEGSADVWNQSLVDHFGTRGELIFETSHQFAYLTVNHTWLFCPIARYFGYCEYIKSAFRQAEFAYGWQILRFR